MNFSIAFGLVVVNSSFLKEEENLVTFHSTVDKTHIDYLLLRKEHKVLHKDCWLSRVRI